MWLFKHFYDWMFVICPSFVPPFSATSSAGDRFNVNGILTTPYHNVVAYGGAGEYKQDLPQMPTKLIGGSPSPFSLSLLVGILP